MNTPTPTDEVFCDNPQVAGGISEALPIVADLVGRVCEPCLARWVLPDPIRDKMKKRNASSLWITAIVVFPFAVLNIRSSMKRLFPNATASMKSSIKQVNVVAVDDLLSFVRNYP